MNVNKPAPIFPSAEQVPEELRDLKRWIGFRYKWTGHNWNKPPCSPVDGSAIGAVEKYSNHFVTFAEAITGAATHKLDGVGFVFNGDDFCGVDFDDCHDP